MSESKMKVTWDLDRIRALPVEKIRILRQNALDRDLSVAARCDEVLAAFQNNSRRRINNRTDEPFRLPEDAVDRVATLFRNLPDVAGVQNGVKRREMQRSPIKTLGDLWTQFIMCGFSSQENSNDGAKLSLFIKGNSPILSLRALQENNCNSDWVTSHINEKGLRFPQKKISLVSGNYAHFSLAGDADTPLSEACIKNGPLKIFCDLARGSANDKDIRKSREFSATLKHSELPGIGLKQLRNILVNSGLAHNVIPLDSRWLNYLADIVPNKINRPRWYLAIEDLIRNALIETQKYRNDIENLAVLDAVVFALQSSEGISTPAWGDRGSAP